MEGETQQMVDQNIPLWMVGNQLRDTDLEMSVHVLENENSVGYDIIGGQISNSKFRTRVEGILTQAALNQRKHVYVNSLTADEVNISPGHYIPSFVAFASPWIEVDAVDPLLAHVSRQVLNIELAYAAFCGVAHVVIPGPKLSSTASEYGQAICAALTHATYMHLLVQMPIEYQKDGASYDELASWDNWNTIRTICKYSSQLQLALQMTPRLPHSSVIQRWFAEPIRIIQFPASCFCPNNKGFPVLTKPHQHLISTYMRLKPTPYIFLSETDVPLTPRAGSKSPPRHEPLSYLIYLRHLQKTQPPLSKVDSFGSGYQDYLQAPLQPLADNLESITYEVFEKDPVKYDQYEKAIQLALEDRQVDTTVVLAVVGAGRGPLVTRALRAAKRSKRTVKVVAVEKNPNAYVHLLGKNRDVWDNEVTVIKSDMRSWKPEFMVDIMVSELLGSFADNELSPECLDGVQRVLNPSGGVMIPQSYSAHLSPIMAPKIHADISGRKSDPDAAETPYVVMLQSIENLAQDNHIQKVWEFNHPLDVNILTESAAFGGGIVGLGEGGNDHNLRSSKTTFKIPRRGVIHGLAGYFESVLYGNIELSTRPDTIDAKSMDMISWFPIFFPLKTPLYIPDNSEVDVSMWRCSSERKVWYEWIVEGYFAGENGRRFCLGTSDLHSSKKNGCLM
ncbi:PRMT5 arginine-N-methyltransferase-domain-containing protein [Geopyxis carbonaria]|nr:PRMT5 arginine-N-methyltransferase-domain-containing protein [Geopyxis carbonaria]